MRKIVAAVAFPLFLGLQAQGQIKKIDDVKKSLETSNKDTVAWNYGGVLNIGLNEGFLHNWAAGGEIASMAVNGIFHGHLDRLHHHWVWSNNLDLTYGLNYVYSTGFLPKKTDDRIDFTSKYGRKVRKSNNMYFTGLFNFKSQFTKGYDYTNPNWQTNATSTFFSPAYFTIAAGLEYRMGSDFTLFFSPLAGRLTMADLKYTTLSPNGAFGIHYGKTTDYQFGAYFSGRRTFTFSPKMSLASRLDLYSNYLAKNRINDSGELIKDSPANISFLFDNLFSYKVSKYLNLTLGLTMIYDNNIPYSKTYVDNTGATVKKDDPGREMGWMQIKQVFALGMEFKF